MILVFGKCITFFKKFRKIFKMFKKQYAWMKAIIIFQIFDRYITEYFINIKSSLIIYDLT